MAFRLESPSGGPTPLLLVATNISFDADSQQVHAFVALRNTGSETLPGPNGVLVSGLLPPEVWPVNARVVECLVPPCPSLFDHRGTYGDDNALSPGETSTPVEWIFHDPQGQSFGFRASLAVRPEEPPRGQISGFVFSDANGNGKREVGEPGIPNVPVGLRHDSTGATTQTDDNGHFAFQVEEPGLYEVSREPSVEPMRGCEPTTPVRLQVIIIRRADGTLSGFDRALFGCRAENPPPPRPDSEDVAGVVFEDLNRDGRRDPGEPGVPGVRVCAGSPCMAPCGGVSCTTTDARGQYRLLDPAGCCPLQFVAHDSVAGWFDTTPNPVHLLDAPPMPPFVFRVDFGMARGEPPPPPPWQTYRIQGVVFRDANGNGQRDRGEPGIPDVGLTAAGRCLLPVLAQTRTDAQGHYLLRGADVHCPLPWMLRREPLPGTRGTTPNPVLLDQPPPAGSDTYSIDFGVAAGDSTPPPTAGFEIAGTVFVDANRNGARDRGEPGIPGALLELLSHCNALVQVHTGPDGAYRFDREVVGRCGAGGVRLVEPVFPGHTTPNPALLEGPVPPGTSVRLDFGVVLVPRRTP